MGEGQEPENTDLGNYHQTIMLQLRTAPCPISIQDKCDDDKEERKGQTWPVFSDNVANFRKPWHLFFWHNCISDDLRCKS